MNQYRVLEGIHFDANGKKYEKGEIVESPHDLMVMFPLKFALVTIPAPVPVRKFTGPGTEDDGWEDTPESEQTPAQKAQRAGRKTMRG